MLYKRDYQQPFWRGFLHAVLVGMYSLILSLILASLDRLFGSGVGVIIHLTFYIFLVIFSLALLGYLIFFEPLRFAIHHHFKAASVMMASTLGWLLLFLVVFLVGLVQTLGTGPASILMYLW